MSLENSNMVSDHNKKLSSDEIFEILTRTSSLKTLDACKCVSKNWQKLIYESSFMPLYCKRTDNIFGYFIQDLVSRKLVNMFVEMDQSKEKRGNINVNLPDDMRILASCNQGLLCCLGEKYRKYRFYVSKPATKQWQALPNPKLRYWTVGVAVMVLGSSPFRYRVIRLSKLRDFVDGYSTTRCEIFDSECWKWRETQSLYLPFDDNITHSNPAVRVGKYVLWLTYNDNVVAFHEANEYFNVFPVPQTVLDLDYFVYKSKTLVDYQGQVGFTCLRMELWVKDGPMNHYEWTMKMAVDFSGLHRRFNFLHPSGFYNAEIVFIKASDEVVFYKLQDDSAEKVELAHGFWNALEFFQFRSDFEPVDLRGGRSMKLA